MIKEFEVNYASRVYSNRHYCIVGTFETNDNEIITTWNIENVIIELESTIQVNSYSYSKPALGCEETKEFEQQLESQYFMKLKKYTPDFYSGV